MSTLTKRSPSEMAILRRVVVRKDGQLSPAAAKSILQLDFDAQDRRRINELAAKNRAGGLTQSEEEELGNFIHVGQLLGILKSKARKVLKAQRGQGKKP